jgi:hypothetical protein
MVVSASGLGIPIRGGNFGIATLGVDMGFSLSNLGMQPPTLRDLRK